MKKHLLLAFTILACTFCCVSGASAQSASFTFNDGNGQGNAGSYAAGSSFTFSITLAFTPGGSIANLEGLSYWFEQQSGGPFIFSITNRNMAGSTFDVPQTASLTYPQPLAPQNPDDLGAARTSLTGVGVGSYFIANVTVSINPSAANGTYFIGSTASGPKTSVISDDQGHTFAIPAAAYAISVVPDAGSTALMLGLGFAGLVYFRRQQQRA